MSGSTAVNSLPIILERLNQKFPDARYELNWENPLQLLVATILAAQCTDERVNKITPAVFKKYPNAKAYAEVKIEDLGQDIKGSGFYRNKARAIQGACKGLVERFNGEVPKTMEEMLTLDGVARKTANVVLNNAFRIPTGIIVDTHVARVSRRMGLTEQKKPEKIEQDLMRLVPQNDWLQFGPAMVLLGRYTCTFHEPKCGSCLMKDLCPKLHLDAAAEADEDPAAEAPTPATAKKPTSKAKAPVPVAQPKLADLPGLADQLPPDWAQVLADEVKKPYFHQLAEFVTKERAEHDVFPPSEDVFNAFRHTPFSKVKVLLLGQDPYHDDGQAHGLCFSVRPGVKAPPSLVNIFKELQDDLGCKPPRHGHLTAWADQGVMLLNAVLTVRAHEPASHKDQGWETFTDAVIRALNQRTAPVVFLLWGAYAQKKAELIDAERHTVLTAAHPSPLSAKKFFGSKPFSKTNEALKKMGQAPIDWQLPESADDKPTPANGAPESNVKTAVASAPAPVAKPVVAAPAPAPAPASPVPGLMNTILTHLHSLRAPSQMPESWLKLLAPEFEKPYFRKLERFVDSERQAHPVFPSEEDVFAAFRLTPFDEVRVVLMGENPWPLDGGIEHGLAYSLPAGVPVSPRFPAVQNLFQELRNDLGCWLPTTGCLIPWARQGVLLLNNVLTTRAGDPDVHRHKGWETFTDAVISALNQRSRTVVFMLCGAAKSKTRFIAPECHTVLELPHPADKSFLGTRPFSKVNTALELSGEPAVYWQLRAI